MALLTEHDVLHKKFQASKFRQEGYNQDEVDDFLDEVADTIRALTLENEGLKKGGASLGGEQANAQLQAEIEGLRAANAQLQQEVAQAHNAVQSNNADEALRGENHELRERLAHLESELQRAQAEAETARTEAEAAHVAKAAQAEANAGAGPEAATGMLALAQRLHDEYVRNGKEEGERLVREATSEGERILREAQEQHARTIAQMDEEKSNLEAVINGLRDFESDYRGRITEYLQSLLHNVSNSNQS